MSILMDACLFCPKMFPNDGDSIASAGSLLYFAILTKSSLQPNLKLPMDRFKSVISASNDHEHEERIIKKMKRTIAFKIF